MDKCASWQVGNNKQGGLRCNADAGQCSNAVLPPSQDGNGENGDMGKWANGGMGRIGHGTWEGRGKRDEGGETRGMFLDVVVGCVSGG